MATFTVHEPPPRKNETAASPVRFAFVRDGFYFWAFVLGPVWMLYHRLWLVFVMYLAGMTAVEVALWALGVSMAIKLTVALLIALLVGFEAGSMRRWSLRRWTSRGIVVAPKREAAEYRFFEHWTDESARYMPAEPPASPPGGRVPTSEHDVIGLFPEPQARP